MTTDIDAHGKGHQILAYLATGPATLSDILDAVAPQWRNDRAKISNRLRVLCRSRLVCWSDPVPPDAAPMSPAWWADCRATFRLTRTGKQALSELDAVPTVRVFGRAA